MIYSTSGQRRKSLRVELEVDQTGYFERIKKCQEAVSTNDRKRKKYSCVKSERKSIERHKQPPGATGT